MMMEPWIVTCWQAHNQATKDAAHDYRFTVALRASTALDIRLSRYGFGSIAEDEPTEAVTRVYRDMYLKMWRAMLGMDIAADRLNSEMGETLVAIHREDLVDSLFEILES